MIVRWRTIIAASLSLVIFSATISVLMGISSSPDSFIGNQNAYVITSTGTGNLLNSLLDTRLADQLEEGGFVRNVSPEIFAFAEIDGKAVIARGVDFGQFMAVENATLVDGGRLPNAPSEGLIGHRLAERIDAKIGDRFPLVGSYNPAVAEVRIAGIITCSSSIEDELMVSLPLARCLSDVPDGYVSIIRVTGNLTELNRIFGADTPRFSIYDLSVSKSSVSLGSSVEIGLSLKNWGDANGSAHVTMTDQTTNTTLIENYSYLVAGDVEQLKVACYFDTVGNHSIVAHLDSSLPQTIYANITVSGPSLSLIAQSEVVEFHNFTVQVVDGSLASVQNSKVSIGGFEYLTDADGLCTVDDHLVPGDYTLTANLTGYYDATALVTVINPSTLQSDAWIKVYNLELAPSTVKTNQNCTIAIYIQNYGNTSGSSFVNTSVHGGPQKSTKVYLQPLESKVIYYNMSFSTSGSRLVSSSTSKGTFSVTLKVESNVQPNPELIQLLLRYGGTSSLSPTRGELLYHTAKISESNIIIVIVSLAILSGLLVTLGISTSFMKEINDNQKVIGILRSLGASSKRLSIIIFRESIIVSLPAAAVGVIGGFVLALFIQSTQSLYAFGHLINPVLNPTFLLAAAAGSVVICVGSSLTAGVVVARRRAIKMIRGLKEEPTKQITLEELLEGG
jgi:ABC-type antimicrobial peptide transport system permease subunit